MIYKLFTFKFLLPFLLFISISTLNAYGKETGNFVAGQFFENSVSLRQSPVHELFIRSELYFGMNKSGGEISEEEFAEFLEKTITPEFPDGLTVLSGTGQFRDASGKTIQEKSKVLILFYPSAKRKQVSRKIERIRAAYKTKFGQLSVLRIDAPEPVRVSF